MNKCIDYDKACQDRYWWLNKTGGTAHDNMTVLDYFAGQALMSMLSPVQNLTKETPEVAAEWAYRFATAMMEERAKQESNDA